MRQFPLRSTLAQIYHYLKSQIRVLKYPYWMLVDLGYKLNLFSVYEIPIVINNFNRLTCILHLVEFLERYGYTNIIIIDNNSTYPPLLEFYKECKYLVMRESYNYGHLALWKSGLYKKYRWNYFVYTDSDVVPTEDCPEDFMKYFQSMLTKKHELDKIGFGIKIDDLPEFFSLKKKVVEYESRYWNNQISPNIYEASIDTTFALYRPLSALKEGQAYTMYAYRLGSPYLIRHLPWYVDSENLTEEEQYYMRTCNDSSSLGQHYNGNRYY